MDVCQHGHRVSGVVEADCLINGAPDRIGVKAATDRASAEFRNIQSQQRVSRADGIMDDAVVFQSAVACLLVDAEVGDHEAAAWRELCRTREQDALPVLGSLKT